VPQVDRPTRQTGVSIVKVGLCGHGYWGQNFLRTFSSDPRFEVVAVSDIRESARDKVRRRGYFRSINLSLVRVLPSENSRTRKSP
jgi:predicted homoserine dehydrogenase-like protein